MNRAYKTFLLASMLSVITITGVQAHGVRPYHPPETEQKPEEEANKNDEQVKVEEPHEVIAPTTSGYTEERKRGREFLGFKHLNGGTNE